MKDIDILLVFGNSSRKEEFVIGNNELRLNHTVMKEAVQDYLDKITKKREFEVVDVDISDKGNYSGRIFTIKTVSPNKEEDKSA